jgi:hypothetical protein
MLTSEKLISTSDREKNQFRRIIQNKFRLAAALSEIARVSFLCLFYTVKEIDAFFDLEFIVGCNTQNCRE